MKFALTTVGHRSEKQPESRDTRRYVRRHWSIFLGYYFVTSFAVGFGIAATMFLFLALGLSKHGTHKPVPVHAAVIFSSAVLGTVFVVTFLIQLMSGPFVFTTDVVCRKCHTRLRVGRVAFFTGRYARPPRCGCGGKIEPAFLWMPQVSTLGSGATM